MGWASVQMGGYASKEHCKCKFTVSIQCALLDTWSDVPSRFIQVAWKWCVKFWRWQEIVWNTSELSSWHTSRILQAYTHLLSIFRKHTQLPTKQPKLPDCVPSSVLFFDRSDASENNVFYYFYYFRLLAEDSLAWFRGCHISEAREHSVKWKWSRSPPCNQMV